MFLSYSIAYLKLWISSVSNVLANIIFIKNFHHPERDTPTFVICQCMRMVSVIRYRGFRLTISIIINYYNNYNKAFLLKNSSFYLISSLYFVTEGLYDWSAMAAIHMPNGSSSHESASTNQCMNETKSHDLNLSLSLFALLRYVLALRDPCVISYYCEPGFIPCHVGWITLLW